MTGLQARREATFQAWRESDWHDVATFLGPNAERFHTLWLKTRDNMVVGKASAVWTWCWPAFFLSFAWFFYRKQWAIGAVLLLLPVGLALIFDLPSGGLIGIGIVIAAQAKSFILQDAVSKIARIKAAGGGEAEMAQAGGVSITGGLLGGAAIALGLLAVVLSMGATVP
jgi:hypothetical protein